MIGGFGWLDRAAAEPSKPQGASSALKSVVPAVRKAAFDLDLGMPSDLAVSQDGVHLLLRRACAAAPPPLPRRTCPRQPPWGRPVLKQL